MPAIHVSKSITIEASAEKVFQLLSDFHHWPAWSPWLVLEPGATVDVKPDGKFYSWEGKRTGSGEMKIVSETAPHRLDLLVTFLKPWKSSSPVWFELNDQGNATEVIWHMDSKLPFFMFWMKKMMTAYIGLDYTRGLMMLKDYAETGAVPSKLDFKGISQYAGCSYVGIKTSCTLETVGAKMAEDFNRLSRWASNHAGTIAGNFSIYHKWDAVNNSVMYTSAFPVKEIPSELPNGFITGKIPAVNVNTVVHTGPYKFLGNAWSAQYSMQRAKEFKYRKGIDPFETYTNMPGAVPEHELITEVHFPVR